MNKLHLFINLIKPLQIKRKHKQNSPNSFLLLHCIVFFFTHCPMLLHSSASFSSPPPSCWVSQKSEGPVSQAQNSPNKLIPGTQLTAYFLACFYKMHNWNVPQMSYLYLYCTWSFVPPKNNDLCFHHHLCWMWLQTASWSCCSTGRSF